MFSAGIVCALKIRSLWVSQSLFAAVSGWFVKLQPVQDFLVQLYPMLTGSSFRRVVCSCVNAFQFSINLLQELDTIYAKAVLL